LALPEGQPWKAAQSSRWSPPPRKHSYLGAEEEEGKRGQVSQGSGEDYWLKRRRQREQKINDNLPGSHLVLIAPVVIN
jgi:hypothetical protein